MVSGNYFVVSSSLFWFITTYEDSFSDFGGQQ